MTWMDCLESKLNLCTLIMFHINNAWKTCMHTPHVQHKTIDTYNYAWDLFSNFPFKLFMKVQGNP